MSLSLPYYKSKRSFERYAAIIGDAVEIYPQAIIIDPSTLNLSLETFSNRFAYAVKSAHEFNYTSPLVKPDLFNLYWNQIKCVMRVGVCVIGSREAIAVYDEEHKTKQPEVVTPYKVTLISPAPPTHEITFSGSTRDLEGLVWLVINKCLTPMPSFIITQLDESTKCQLEILGDVLIEETEVKGQYRIC